VGACASDRRQQRPFSFTLFQQSAGRRVLPNRLTFRVRRSTAGSLRLPATDLRRRALRDGVYLARVTMDLPGVDDVRRIVLRPLAGSLVGPPDAYLRSACGVLSAFKLDKAAFGGSTKRPLRVSYRLPRAVDSVSVEVLRGRKVVRTIKAGSAGRAYRFTVPSSVARAGQDVRVRITIQRARAPAWSRRGRAAALGRPQARGTPRPGTARGARPGTTRPVS
jgi:hypothetical protein